MMKMNFSYHLVTMSPWPLHSSLTIMWLMLGFLNLLNNKSNYLMMLSNMLLMMILFQWWRDIVRESTYQGYHSIKIMTMLKMSMMLFIISELMFFISFFWCYFHMYLSPSIMFGNFMPPLNILNFNPYSIPLLNTMILLVSGMTITTSHHSILINNSLYSSKFLLITLFLSFMFTFFQCMEYKEAYFSITDSMFGSIFFMTTGFHGIHVIIGTTFIFIMMMRLYLNQFSSYHHFGFEAASWYWHFVDMIWLILYLSMYWMPFN